MRSANPAQKELDQGRGYRNPTIRARRIGKVLVHYHDKLPLLIDEAEQRMPGRRLSTRDALRQILLGLIRKRRHGIAELHQLLAFNRVLQLHLRRLLENADFARLVAGGDHRHDRRLIGLRQQRL